MTKERLEELIKQGATIGYEKCRWGCPIIKLDTVHFVIVNDRLYYQKNKKRIGDGWELKELREDVDRCKWKHKMFSSRTERFEPLMWEDIKNRYSFGFCKNFEKYEEYYILDVSKNCDINWAITVETDSDMIYHGKATKENYEKACEIVRDLFKGEK